MNCENAPGIRKLFAPPERSSQIERMPLPDPRSLPVGTEVGDGIRVGHGGVYTATVVQLPAVQPQREEQTMSAIAAAPRKTSGSKKKPVKKSKLAKAKEKDNAALAKFLLANITYPDQSWSDRADGKSRRKDESRSDFIRRCLLGEEAS